jgi:hypothetical protein
MIPPKNFYEINGKYFQSNGHEFYIECNEFEKVWLFPACEPDFDKCILLDYDWTNKKFSIKICDLGQGTAGYYIERNLSILRDEILTMSSYTDKLKNIATFHFNKLTKIKK